MKRGIITNNGAVIHISDGEVWMTAWEIADLFYTTVGVINSRIKAILKANILNEYEVCQCVRLENGNYADVYNLNMIIALSYQIDAGHSTAFRKWLISKVVHKQNCNILLYLNEGANSTLYC
ncbi:lipofamily protein [Bacteroides fluxus]|uniref:lipofamily protein n=1 Tax=Bacteroides fluxus TaxID=626930 RepID=UPI002354452B|nr:lipofamily protein [Bacteroides fluxus]